MTPTFCPVYLKDGNELIVLLKSWTAPEEEDAYKIALGSMLVECILYGMKFKEVRSIDVNNLRHYQTKLGDVPVAIISGPVFDQVVAAQAAPV